MGEVYEYHFNAKVIRDLPKSTETVIRIIMGETEELPEIELPEHELFENREWHVSLQLAFADTGFPHTLRFRNNRLFIMMETENPGAVRDFIDWIFPYLIRTATPRCIGYYRVPDGFPCLISNTRNELSVINTEEVFCSGRPVIVDPDGKKITVMPSMDEVKKACKKDMPELLKMMNDPENLN